MIPEDKTCFSVHIGTTLTLTIVWTDRQTVNYPLGTGPFRKVLYIHQDFHQVGVCTSTNRTTHSTYPLNLIIPVDIWHSDWTCLDHIMGPMLQKVTSAEKPPQRSHDRVMWRPHVGSLFEVKSRRVSEKLKLSKFQDGHQANVKIADLTIQNITQGHGGLKVRQFLQWYL